MGGDMDGGETIRLMKVLLTFMVSLLYCYFIASKLPKGKLRFLSLLPIFSIFVLLPLYLSSVFLTSTIAFFVTCLTTFKLLLFSFGSGPLAHNPPFTFPLFASIAFFPTRISTQNAPKVEPPPKLPLTLPTKVAIFAILVLVNRHYVELLGLRIANVELLGLPIAKLSINCGMFYFYLDMIMSLSNTFIRLTFGVKVKQPFNEPYLATSLQNFWGRRWNLFVSETLHDMIYKPVRYKMGSPRWAAVIVVFFVSGLMHELLYYYIIKVNPTWEATWYFVIHGVCVAVEIELKTMFKNKLKLHWIVSSPLTMAFVLVTTNCLFFTPLLRM